MLTSQLLCCCLKKEEYVWILQPRTQNTYHRTDIKKEKEKKREYLECVGLSVTPDTCEGSSKEAASEQRQLMLRHMRDSE